MSTQIDFDAPIFKWKLPHFVATADASSSSGTRDAGFFDAHLHEDLVLKHTQSIPELATFFIRLALNTIANLSDKRKAAFNAMLVSKTWKDVYEAAASRAYVKDEGSLQEVVCENISGLPLKMASFLLFRHDANFQVSIASAAEFRATGGKAKLDLYLDLADDCEERKEFTILREMLAFKKGGSPMVWEMKSLAAGDLATMTAVATKEGEYTWIRCLKGNCGDDHWTRSRFTITGAPTGPDCSLAPLFDGAVNVATEASKSGSSRTVNSGEAGLSLMNAVPKSKEVKLTPETKAQLIHQQVWAGAVAADATLVVISSGNMESNYLLLQVGMIIFAYGDALRRAQALKDGINPFSSLKYDYPSGKSQSNLDSLEAKATYQEMVAAFPDVISRLQIIVSDARGYAFHPSRSLELDFEKYDCFTKSSNSSRKASEGSKGIIQLQARSYRGSDHVYEGTLVVPGSHSGYRVFVKIGQATYSVKQVVYEYKQYSRLQAKMNGLPISLGLYRHFVELETQTPLEEEFHCIWVTLWGGKDLTDHSTLDVTARRAFRCLLSSLHHLGWAHNALHDKHLVWDEVSKTATLLNLGHCKEVGKHSGEEKKVDKNILKGLLRRREPKQRAIVVALNAKGGKVTTEYGEREDKPTGTCQKSNSMREAKKRSKPY